MKKLITWLWWRVTGWREISRLLHALYGNYDALTPTGLDRLHELSKQENEYYYKNAPFS